MGSLHIPTKPEQRASTTNLIGKLEIPVLPNNVIYRRYKNMTRVVYMYVTTYPVRRERKRADMPQFPTCGKGCYSKGRITTNRKDARDA